MRVKDLFHLSITYEESALAHYIYHLLEEEKITLEDDAEKLDFAKADHTKVAEMIENNLLGFHHIHLFALSATKGKYFFIFARNEEEAIRHFTKTFQRKPRTCKRVLLDHEVMRGNEVVTFRTLRKEYTKFPVIIGKFFLTTQ